MMILPSCVVSNGGRVRYCCVQLVAQRIKVKSMDARMDMEAQYGEEIRDTRTLRQKVQLWSLHCPPISLLWYFMYVCRERQRARPR